MIDLTALEGLEDMTHGPPFIPAKPVKSFVFQAQEDLKDMTDSAALACRTWTVGAGNAGPS